MAETLSCLHRAASRAALHIRSLHAAPHDAVNVTAMRCLIVVALLTTRAVVGRRNQFVLHELEESQRPLLLRRREVERVVASRRRLDAKRQREV